MLKIDATHPQALFGVNAVRQLELASQRLLPPHTLMQRAGLAIAQCALAVAPHARCIWMACGPGNNGGDGLEAARHLHLWGKTVVVTWLGSAEKAPPDSLVSYQQASQAGVVFVDTPPPNFDLCIDALLGIGASARAPQGVMAAWITHMNNSGQPILAVDLPTGLDAESGMLQTPHVRATHTLCLLTLKPGLYTAHGRDLSGTVWLADLEVDQQNLAMVRPSAYLSGKHARHDRLHASHKGSFGDVAVIGGAPGMTGAALLAASAALHAGAGRVFVSLLDDQARQVDDKQPELMFRPFDALDLAAMVVVCGCGGGTQIEAVLAEVLSTPSPLVLDADALNALAESATLQALLIKRSKTAWPTLLTPHPLEAARLLKTKTQDVQKNRLQAAQQLAHQFACIVVLKGSGTVIAAPEQVPFINPTGNGKLATPGSGDVLAGLLGARLAAGQLAFSAACDAVYRHGEVADQWPQYPSLTAGMLAKML